jgi:short-subunit dehydrogenase
VRVFGETRIALTCCLNGIIVKLTLIESRLVVKTIVITGCSSGLGAAIAAALAKRGHWIFATARDVATLKPLTDAYPDHIFAHPLDVTDEAQVYALQEVVLEYTGGAGPDVVINNAGIGAMGPVEETPLPIARACLETNVLGMLSVTQAFLPAMRSRRKGHIVNISSLVGRVVMPYEGVYVASKHAVEGLSDALRFEVAPFGINVTIVEPGAVQTDFERRGNVQLGALPLNRSAYHDHVIGFESQRAKAFEKAPTAAQAAQYFVRIVEAKNPPTRFLFPGQPRFLNFVFGTFSDRMTDAIKRWAFKVPRYAATS